MSCDSYVEQLKNLFLMIRKNTINDTNIYFLVKEIK
jgi:hypothetical protein